MYKRQLIISGVLVLCLLPFLALISGGSVSQSDIGLVTDAGSIFDKSFNQSSWEGILKVHPQASTSLDAIQPIRHNPSDLVNAYSVHAAGNKKYVVAPGFYHFAGIRDWNNEGYENLLKFILLDADATENGTVSAPNVASVIYDTKAAGFLAGNLASLYLNAKKDLNEPGYEVPKIGMWGGGLFPGVTDFMVGLVYGVKHFNNNNLSKKVSFAKFPHPSQYTDSGFESGKGASKAAYLLGPGKAQVLLSVSGPQVADAITEIQKTANKNQKVIGVDSDGTLKFPTQKEYFITSILKELTKSVVGVYHRLSGQPTPDYFKGAGQVTRGTIANSLTSIANNTNDPNGAWKGILDAQSFYQQSTSASIIAAALAAVENKDWPDALKELDNL